MIKIRDNFYIDVNFDDLAESYCYKLYEHDELIFSTHASSAHTSSVEGLIDFGVSLLETFLNSKG